MRGTFGVNALFLLFIDTPAEQPQLIPYLFKVLERTGRSALPLLAIVL